MNRGRIEERRWRRKDKGRDGGEVKRWKGREEETKCRSRRKMKRKKEGRWLTNGHRVQRSQ